MSKVLCQSELNSPLMVGCVIWDILDDMERDNLNCLVNWRRSGMVIVREKLLFVICSHERRFSSHATFDI
jgi:hypothetical protein